MIYHLFCIAFSIFISSEGFRAGKERPPGWPRPRSRSRTASTVYRYPLSVLHLSSTFIVVYYLSCIYTTVYHLLSFICYLSSIICHLLSIIYELLFVIQWALHYLLFSRLFIFYETISVRVQRFGLRVDGVGFLRGMRVRALRWRPQGSPRPQSQSRSAYRAYHHLTFSLHLSSIIETSFSFIISFIIYHFSHLSSIVYSSLFIIYYRFSMKNRASSSKHFIMYYFHYSTIFLCD